MVRARSWAIGAASLLVGIAVCAIALPFWIRSAEHRRWDEMRQWCENAAREARARDPRRPVLRGVAVEGNAWDDYHAALAAMEAASGLLFDYSKVDPGKVRALVELHAPALQTLRRGASRSFARREVAWENPPNTVSTKESKVAILAICRAQFLLKDGQPREAMEVLLDTGQFGADRALNGTVFDGLVGLSILWSVLDELKQLLASSTLSREDCLEMARELEVLDRNFPREAEGYALGPLEDGFTYLQKETIRGILEPMGITKPSEPAVATWRFGFSERLVLVDAFQTQIYWGRQLREAAGKSWKDARQIEQRLHAERPGRSNPLIREFLVIQATLSDSDPRNFFRERRAQLRLLRAVAHFRATGEFPTLEDPYGDKIRISMTQTQIKLWSVGGDGVDDGGTGEWDARKGKDIVLEVQRGAVQEK